MPDDTSRRGLANRIAALREERGWSQDDLALRIRKSGSTVSRWERGVGGPKARDILALTVELGCSTNFLIEGRNPSIPPDRLSKLEEIKRMAISLADSTRQLQARVLELETGLPRKA